MFLYKFFYKMIYEDVDTLGIFKEDTYQKLDVSIKKILDAVVPSVLLA